MGLVRVINNGTVGMPLWWAGQKYFLDPNGGEIMIEESVAKHWVGDWDLKKDNEIMAENRRLSKLHRNFPNPDIRIVIKKVQPVIRTQKEELEDKQPLTVNPYLEPPKEKEFEELENMKGDNMPFSNEDYDREPVDFSDRSRDEAIAEKKAIERHKAKNTRQ